MFTKKSSRPEIKQTDIKTYISEMTKIEGRFVSDSDTLINGTLEGEVEINGKLIVGKEALIKASVKAAEVRIEGRVEGNIESLGEVEISETGKVTGDITLSGDLIIQPGAVFRGASLMKERSKDELDDMDLDDPSQDSIDLE